MTREPHRLSGGFYSLEAGMSSGENPSIIGDNQYWYSVNATNRGGFITNRPGYRQIILRFYTQEAMDYFQSNHFQCAAYYRPVTVDPRPMIIAMIGGRIFRILPEKLTGNNVDEITPDTGNPNDKLIGWMVQADKYLVIQDGESVPIIFDGASCRRSRIGAPLFEVPTGCMMEYCLGRLVVVLPGRSQYVVGDLINSGKEVIQFTENEVLNEGGAITVPIDGPITALKIIAVLDRATGQGDLVVHTPQGACTAQIGANRTTWKEIQFQKTAVLKFGSRSQTSTVLLNGDMFYRSFDGIRTLAIAQRDFQSRWATTPVSHEVEEVLKYDDRSLLEHCWAVNFDNRVLMTVNPARNNGRIYNRGLVALNLDPLSTMREKQPPAYDGVWSGLQPMGIVTGDFPNGERCFVFHYNAGTTEFWEISPDDPFDGDNVPIASSVITKSMSCGKPFDLKKLDAGDLFRDLIQGEVSYEIKYRPDQYPAWLSWHSWSECSTYRDCSATAGCMELQNFQSQYRPKSRLPQPPDTDNSIVEIPCRLGYEFQFKISWVGKARLKSFRFHTLEQQERPYGAVETEACKSFTGCGDNPYTYLVASQPNEAIT